MGSWLRSEPMSYYSLVMSEETAPAIVRVLGSLSSLHFKDMNPSLTPFQRRYIGKIKRYDEIERRIRFVYEQIKKFEGGITIKPSGEEDYMMAMLRNINDKNEKSQDFSLELLDEKLSTMESQLTELKLFGTQLSKNLISSADLDCVLSAVMTKFIPEIHSIETVTSCSKDKNRTGPSSIEMTNLIDPETREMELDLAFTKIYGVIEAINKHAFERILYRSTRGNSYLRFYECDNPAYTSPQLVFMIMYKSNVIDRKVRRICESFTARLYDVGDVNDIASIQTNIENNRRRMKETKSLIARNHESQGSMCTQAAEEIELWLWHTRRDKSVYHNLNLMQSDIQGILVGNVWVQSSHIDEVRSEIVRVHNKMRLPMTTIFEPVRGSWPQRPTHFDTNKYTVAFQQFVDTYGIPRYQEINPALFTAATFPFLFGIMYGDIGHGSCIALAGIIMIFTESNVNKRGAGDMMKGVYMGRYMFLAMGLCGVYAGLIYNDFFSLGLNLFGTSYTWPKEPNAGSLATSISEYGDSSAVYPFGTDPAWKISENELLFYNSMKMKMSVILGIIQMLFGVVIRGLNCIYFNNYIDLVCDVVPMMLFGGSFFGYMIVLIFTKWSIDWNHRMALGTCNFDADGIAGACSTAEGSCFNAAGDACHDGSLLADVCTLDMGGTGDGCSAPNLVTTLIGIVLQPGAVAEPMFYGQNSIQTAILIISGITVPWLLLSKPLYLNYLEQTKGHRKEYSDIPEKASLLGEDGDEEDDHGGGHDDHGHGGEFNFSEIFIHQAIETIEFVLGMVSNTASYLRLWALSLAHTELANVFWSKALLGAISSGNPVAIFFGYGLFAGITTCVLLCMDVLECFLHALRLHWVEFQNKFFKADGIKFQPYDLRDIFRKSLLE